jgi:hypothetical protein
VYNCAVLDRLLRNLLNRPPSLLRASRYGGQAPRQLRIQLLVYAGLTLLGILIWFVSNRLAVAYRV